MTCSPTGQVHGGAPTPVAFSSVWSLSRRRFMKRCEPIGPRTPRSAIRARTTPRAMPCPQCIDQFISARSRWGRCGRRNSRSSVWAGTYEFGRPVSDCSIFSVRVMAATPTVPATSPFARSSNFTRYLYPARCCVTSWRQRPGGVSLVGKNDSGTLGRSLNRNQDLLVLLSHR